MKGSVAPKGLRLGRFLGDGRGIADGIGAKSSGSIWRGSSGWNETACSMAKDGKPLVGILAHTRGHGNGDDGGDE